MDTDIDTAFDGLDPLMDLSNPDACAWEPSPPSTPLSAAPTPRRTIQRAFRHCETLVLLSGRPMYGIVCPLEGLRDVMVSECGEWVWLRGCDAHPARQFGGGSVRNWLEAQDWSTAGQPHEGAHRCFVDIVSVSNTDMRREAFLGNNSHFEMASKSGEWPVRDADTVLLEPRHWCSGDTPLWCHEQWAAMCSAFQTEGMAEVVARVWYMNCIPSDNEWPEIVVGGRRLKWNEFVCPTDTHVGRLAPVVLADAPQQPLPWECFVLWWMIRHAYSLDYELVLSERPCAWALDTLAK